MKKFLLFLFTMALGATLFVQPLNAQVSVSATAGTTGPTTYATVKLAFDAVNSGTHQGAVTISITANTAEGTTPATLNSSGAGSALYTSVLVRPTVDGVSISGNPVTGYGVIQLNGADNVTIDGDNPNTAGTNRNLTIANTTTATVIANSAIRIATSAAVTSADNNIIKNCNLNGNVTGGNLSSITSTSGSSNSSFGIFCGGNGGSTATSAPTAITSVTSQTVPAGTTVNNLLIDNNVIIQCARAIVFNGSSAASSTGVTISNNLIGAQGTTLTGVPPYTTPSTTVYTKGMYIAGTTAITITGNTLKNIISYVGTTINAIELASAIGTAGGSINVSNNVITGVVNNASSAANGILFSSATQPYTCSGNTLTNIQTNGSASVVGLNMSSTGTSGLIEKNKISYVYARSSGGYSSSGIKISSGTAITIQNNMIYDLNAGFANTPPNTTFGVYGINIAGGTSHKIYHNSVSLSNAALSGTSEPTACIIIAAAGQTGLDIRNNLLSNTIPTTGAGIINACITLPASATSAMNLTVNNNAYYATAANFVGSQGSTTYSVANFSSAATTPATNWRAYTSTLLAANTNNDNASFAATAATPFVSNTNLHLDLASGQLVNVEQKGDPAVGVTTDIDGDTRPSPNTTNPDLGCDEVINLSCTAAEGGTITPGAASTCAGQAYTMTAIGATTGAGITYQWEISATGGNAGFSNVSDGTGATSTSYTTGTLTAGTYYYRLNVTCSSGPLTGYSTELALTVNPQPTVIVSPTSASYCSPGGTPVTLTASGATTYAWSPATGLDATTGAVVHASPATNITYIVTGTDGGCTNTASAAITVGLNPVVIASATPGNVCLNGSSQLTATLAPAQVKTYSFLAGTGAVLDPMADATQVLASGDDDTPNTTPLDIGFTFNYDGVNYTQFSVSPDGWLLLGGVAATSQYSNSTTSTSNVPKLYPYWDDLATGSTGNVTALVTGSAPDRIFIVQWYLTIPRNATGAANSTMQAWLYEGSNKIEFRYGSMGTGSMTASVGLTGSTPATNFNSVTVSSGTNNTVTANDANSGQPASGTIYTFTPPTPTILWTPGTFLDFDNILNPVASNMTSSVTYTVAATNGGCVSTSNITVNAGVPLSASATANPATPICAGVPAILTGTPIGGGGPYTYSWKVDGLEVSTLQSFSVTPAETTTYSLTINDNCAQTVTTPVIVTVNPLPTAIITPAGTVSICDPNTQLFTGSTNASSPSYQWKLNGTNINGATNTTYTATASGNYSLVATDGATTCSNTSSVGALTISPLPSAITITPASVAMQSGTVQQLVATGGASSPTILSENFNGTISGWTITNGTLSPVASNWYYQAAPYTDAAGSATFSNFTTLDGGKFALSNSDAGGTGSTSDSKLASPVFSTVGYTAATLTFEHCYRSWSSDITVALEISTDGGANWSVLKNYKGTSVGNTANNAQTTANESIGLSSYLNQSSLKLRFNFVSAWGYFWIVDNVVVSGTPIPVDFTWTPTTDLYTDQFAINAYTGGISPVVFTSPQSSITYTATATSPAGCINTQTVTVTTCPEAPGSVAVTDITPTSFVLGWAFTPGTLPTSYTVEVASDELFTSPVPGSPFTVYYPDATLSLSGLNGSNTYFYRIRSNGICSSNFTSVGQVTTLCNPTVAPFTENFETPAFAPACWANVPVSGSFTWSRSTAASANGVGHASALANFYDQASGMYELKTEPFDISGLSAPILKFNYAYASYVVELDELDVYYSTDYGITWTALLLMPGGPNGVLNTGGVTEYTFVPTASQWCTQSIPLPAGTNMVKFRAISAYGNNLYLDNITVSDPTPEFKTLQDLAVSGTVFYDASNTITVAGGGTYFTVTGSGSATLVAGGKINFMPGTSVQGGGYLHAYISPETTCGIAPAAPSTVAGTDNKPNSVGNANFTLYPNPTNGNFTIVQKGEPQFVKVNVEVYSMRGEKLVTETMIGAAKHEFNIAEIPAGLYFVKIIADDYTETIKLVKTR